MPCFYKCLLFFRVYIIFSHPVIESYIENTFFSPAHENNLVVSVPDKSYHCKAMPQTVATTKPLTPWPTHLLLWDSILCINRVVYFHPTISLVLYNKATENHELPVTAQKRSTWQCLDSGCTTPWLSFTPVFSKNCPGLSQIDLKCFKWIIAIPTVQQSIHPSIFLSRLILSTVMQIHVAELNSKPINVNTYAVYMDKHSLKKMQLQFN